jgi:hypothetical protein
MIKRLIFSSFLIFYCVFSFAQLGGKYTYAFLELPFSTRAAALGANTVAIYDKDPGVAISNPSLLNPKMNNTLNIFYNNYLADINYGTASYCHVFKHNITGMAGINYINYGEFTRADEKGNTMGTFRAADYAFFFSGSKELYKRLIAGASLKVIYSAYEKYTSLGTAVDMAVSYHDSSSLMAVTLMVNNLGFQIKPYSPGNREPLPLDIQLGFSKKFAHMPLRIVILAHHLNTLDFTYNDPTKNQQSIFDNTQATVSKVPLSEKILRHFDVGGEFVLSKNFFVRVGYNHQRRKEMTIEGKKGMIGYSWGFGLRIRQFHISYANAFYHIAGRTNSFSISTNFSDFVRKSSKK